MKPKNEIGSKNATVCTWQNNRMIMVELMVDWLEVTWNWYPTASHNVHCNLIFNVP